MDGKWSWVTAGVALGMLNILIFFSGNHLGTTTFYSQTTGYLTNFFFPDWIPISSWTKGTCGGTASLSVGWQWLFVMGLFIGAFAGNKTSKVKIQKEEVPQMWVERFGNKPYLRFTHAFLGGFLLLFGSRLAGGCTSSHVISGMSQMAVSGIVFGMAVFAAGIPTALILYGKGGTAR
ncbi:MAG: YeeE/YedE thiosulfate transporter family protein [Bacillota bacterium]